MGEAEQDSDSIINQFGAMHRHMDPFQPCPDDCPVCQAARRDRPEQEDDDASD